MERWSITRPTAAVSVPIGSATASTFRGSGSMADKPWKKFERDVAKSLGTNRTGPTGYNDSDVIGTLWNVSCKYRANLPKWLLDWFDEAKGFRSAGGKPVLLAIKARGVAGYFVCIEGSTFEDLFGRLDK